jgi:hypothetical protein
VFGGGWIATHLRILDLAGGTVVEVNSGASALALALVLGPRLGFRTEAMRPHSLPLVILGAGLLWFGWFGFNAGSALTTGGVASTAFFNTQVAGAAAVGGWLIVERWRDGHSTTLGGPPERSPAWSGSPRRAAPSTRSAPSSSAPSPAWPAAMPSASSTSWGTTTRSTSSACTASAG